MKFLNWFRRTLRNIGINTPGFTEYFAFGGGMSTASGVRVTEGNALLISTVYQCVRVIADTVASLPCFLYKRTASGKDRAENHAVYRVLHEQPNPFMTPFEMKQTLQGHLCLWGNAYAEIERGNNGQVQNLWPLRPDRMRLQVFQEKVFYYYITPEGGERQLTDVFHLRGLSSDGLIGYSPIALARESLGLQKASEEYRARFFSNDARPGGVLMHPGILGDQAFQQLRKRWDESHQGLSNRSRVAILEEGMQWKDVGIPPDDAQFIQGQEFQKSDIAAIYRVPSYKIGLLKPGTVSFASVEQQAIDFVTDCIRPWLVCWEERSTLSLLTPTERKSLFAEFKIDALLRGDSDSRAKFYQALFNLGAITINEIRSFENMNSIGPDGDRHYLQQNLAPIDMLDDILKAKIAPPQSPGLLEPPAAKPNGALNGAAH
jgi:HK97 family phage portal protein